MQHERECSDIHSLTNKIRLQVLKALDVLIQLPRLAVGNEHNTVRTLEDELPRCVVIHLPWDRVQLKPCDEPRYRAQFER